MTVTIAAAAQYSPSPSALLTVSGLTAGVGSTVDVQRSWMGKSAPVRGAQVAVTGSTMLFVDWDAPFVATSYQVTVRSSAGAILARASSGPVTLNAELPWISDPLNPRMACQVTFHGEALAQLDYVQPGEVIQPLASSEPVAIVGTRAVASNIPLDLICLTLGAKMQALAVLTSAATVCLRVPATDPYSMLPALCYVSAPTVSELPRDVQYGGEVTRIAWTAQIVRGPAAPVIVPTRTCADLLTEASTCADLLTLYDTCNALLIGG